MAAAAITDDICFFQNLDTIAVKRAMFTSSAQRLLLADHTTFDQRVLHALLPPADFDAVVVDESTSAEHVDRMRRAGITVVVALAVPRADARPAGSGRPGHTQPGNCDEGDP